MDFDETVKVKQSHLECIICTEKYRKPKALPCLHSFCLECLERLPKPGRTQIKCPVCRKTHILPLGGVSELPDNFMINSLLDEVGNESEDDTAAQDVIPHSKTNEGTDTSKKSYCVIHNAKEAKYFCFKCGQTLCKNCASVEHRSSDHCCVPLDDAPRRCKDKLEEMLVTVSEIQSRHRRVLNEADESKNLISTETASLVNKVTRDANDLRFKLDEEEKKKKLTLNQIMRHKHTKLDEFIEKINREERQVRQIQGDIKETISDMKEGQLLSMYSMINAKVQHLSVSETEVSKPHLTKPPKYISRPSPTEDFLGTVWDQAQNQLALHHEFSGKEDDEFKLQFAHGVAVCPSGDIVVADFEKRCVSIFTYDGHPKFTLTSPTGNQAGQFQTPVDVAVTSDGNIAVVDKSKFVKIYDASGKNLIRRFSTPQAKGNTSRNFNETTPSLFCVRVYYLETTECLLLADEQQHILSLHDFRGVTLKKIPLSVQPFAIAVNSKNHILVSDTSAGTITAIDIDGRLLFTKDILIDGQQPNMTSGICCDAGDSIYVAVALAGNPNKCLIHQYSNKGDFLGCVAEGLNNPLHMTMTRDGKLVLADKTSVKIYNVN